MSHALIAISSASFTAYMLIPPAGDGTYQFGMFIFAILSGLAATVLEVTK